MARSELSERYDRLMGIVSQVLSLNEEERGFVLDRIAPEAEQPKVKRKRKPKTVATPPKKKGLPAVNDPGWCMAPDCGEPHDNLIHDPKAGYAGYHEFQP